MDEIKATLNLVDPATKSLGFTGGEPLSTGKALWKS